MRKLFIVGWLMLPLGAWAYHEGPGQERMQLESVDAKLAEAKEAAADEDWKRAATLYDEALAEMPELETPLRRAAARRIRLSSAKAKLQGSKLVEARRELSELVSDLGADEEAEVALLDEAREAYANAQYYWTWLMRVEGYTREDWEPEIEVARQNYRLLAERARERDDAQRAEAYLESLESTIQLARLDLDELQGLPLPNQ
ncbi:MAG: hypothetical protein AAFZ87_04235 [Planctomycetota bacterium]